MEIRLSLLDRLGHHLVHESLREHSCFNSNRRRSEISYLIYKILLGIKLMALDFLLLHFLLL